MQIRMAWLGCCLGVMASGTVIAKPMHSVASPTVIVDAHGLGAQGVRDVTDAEGVLWHAEFGSELLLGVQDASLPSWLARDDVRAGRR